MAFAAGTGSVSISLRNGAGNTNNTAGTVTLGSVTAASLAVDSSNFGGSFTASNKVYNGSVAATVGANTLSGLAFATGSNLSRSTLTATFANANAGTGKVVTAAPLTLTGFNGAVTGALNLNGVAWKPTSTADITHAALSLTASNASKVFGTTKTFTGSAFTTSGLVGSETVGSVTPTSTGAASSATVVGGPYAIVPSAATGGTFNAANYTVSYVNGLLTVSPATLVVAALTGSTTKVYDGGLTASLVQGNVSLSGFVGSDSAAVTKTTGTYATKNVGTGLLVSTSLAAGDFTATGATLLSNHPRRWSGRTHRRPAARPDTDRRRPCRRVCQAARPVYRRCVPGGAAGCPS